MWRLTDADGAVDVGDRLVLRRLADEDLAVLGEGDDRRGGARALGVRDDRRLAALQDGDDGVGGAEVDADRSSHGDGLSSVCVGWCWSVVSRGPQRYLRGVRSTFLPSLTAGIRTVFPGPSRGRLVSAALGVHAAAAPRPPRAGATTARGARAAPAGPVVHRSRGPPPEPRDGQTLRDASRPARRRRASARPVHRGGRAARRLRAPRDPTPAARPARWVRLRRGVYIDRRDLGGASRRRGAATAWTASRSSSTWPAHGGDQPRVGRPAVGPPGSAATWTGRSG